VNIAFDLDGTLAEWGHLPGRVGDWLPGAEKGITEMLRGGHRLLVHTCRATWAEGGGTMEVARFLLVAGFAPKLVLGREQAPDPNHPGAVTFDQLRPELGEVGIWVGVGKPIAHLYVDDRGLRFDQLVGWTPEFVQQVLLAAAA
jgi:hypothetical protein